MKSQKRENMNTPKFLFFGGAGIAQNLNEWMNEGMNEWKALFS